MRFLLTAVIIITAMACSSSDDTDNPSNCIIYEAFLGETCNCSYGDFTCGARTILTEREYNRLRNLTSGNPEQCLLVQTIDDVTKENIEGYLIQLDQYEFPLCDGDLFRN